MRTHHQHGFTLVELMVVVTIILLMVAIVLPVYDRAQIVAEKVVCQSRLHQLHIAGLGYAADNRMTAVRIKWHHPNAEVSGNNVAYSDDLFPYLYPIATDKRDYGNKNRPGDGVIDSVFYETTDFFRCPTVQRVDGGVNSPNGQILEYGINHYGRGNSDKDNFHDTMDKIRLTLIANPEVVWFSDADPGSSPEDIGGISRGSWEWPIRWSFERTAFQRHQDGYNIVQVDGAGMWHHGGKHAMNEKWLIRK